MTVPEYELRKRYTQAVKILRAERAMRERVFRADPVKRVAKVAEIEDVLATLAWIKDVLKASGLVEPESIQGELIPDEPGGRRVNYP